MDSREAMNHLQCIIDQGVLVNRRDMVRILRDLGQVCYQDLVDGEIQRQGEGIIVEVASNDHAATVVVNKRLYLNVQAFDYLKLGCDEAGEAVLELVSNRRSLRLLPLSDPLREPHQAVLPDAEAVSQRAIDRLLEDTLAEVYLEDLDEEED